MLIDDVTIDIVAGNGGAGAVAFNKNMNSLGPAGGSGGHGGSVFVVGVSDISALRQFRYKKKFAAQNGQPGQGQFRDGHNGADLTLNVPAGTVIHNKTTNTDLFINNVGQHVLMAKGGLGGKGNFQFRSSRNTSPKRAQPGVPGEKATLHIELKLIADVGLVGLPSAGKSSLLNTLTRAQSKVGNYPFTTLEPNLGSYYGLILADIPGLIEGSSRGRGLGIKFLRHIERTRILFHLVAADSPHPEKDYAIVRGELAAHNSELTRKTEYVFLSKSDTADEATVKNHIQRLKKLKLKPIAISLYNPQSIREVEQILRSIQTQR